MGRKLLSSQKTFNLIGKTFILFLSLNASAGILEEYQYPEDRTYTSHDVGLRPYNARSLYQTSTFVLSFDDGPDAERTPKVLDTLKAFNAKAIFFVITSKVTDETFPLIKRMLDEGHLVGSHGPTHDHSSQLTKEEWKRQTKQSFVDLAKWYKLAGHDFDKLYYRFPYGDYGTRKDYHHINALKEISQELMGDNCIQMAFWDVDSNDWVEGMTPKEVAQNLISNITGGLYIDFKKVNGKYAKYPMQIKTPIKGGVILEHDVHDSTVNGLPLFLQYAQDNDIKLPRIDEVDEFKVTKNCKL